MNRIITNEMDGKRLIEKIKLRNILSFGDKGEEIELQPLNIIIGQNASGKSNFVDAIRLLSWLPVDKGALNFISQNGGISQWVWKGKVKNQEFERFLKLYPHFDIEIDIKPFSEKLNYSLSIGDLTGRISIDNEKVLVDNQVIERESSLTKEDSLISFKGINSKNDYYIKSLIWAFSQFHFYTDITTNKTSDLRRTQPTDGMSESLNEDANNLFLVLNNIEFKNNSKEKIINYLKKFNPKIIDYSFQILGGLIQLYVREEGLNSAISTTRLSDGTLRYLCLLAILCHPEPPPLICIEEPETGLHPDILPTIAELMKEASQRTQLIVTTHSDILVSAFSDMPEAVLVCEKDEDGTHFKRLNEEELKIWMEEYTDLGEIWLRGGIGGTRW